MGWRTEIRELRARLEEAIKNGDERAPNVDRAIRFTNEEHNKLEDRVEELEADLGERRQAAWRQKFIDAGCIDVDAAVAVCLKAEQDHASMTGLNASWVGTVRWCQQVHPALFKTTSKKGAKKC